MELVSEGIAVFKNYFLRSEEVIELAEDSGKWREGTAGKGVNPEVRITSIHDLDPTTELHAELLETVIDGVNEYGQKYKTCRISKGEPLRVGRYRSGGFYAQHSDSSGSERVLSAILYLNSDFEGGELKFEHQNVTIKPEEGMLVLFPSSFLFVHESLPIKEGLKYIVVGWLK